MRAHDLVVFLEGKRSWWTNTLKIFNFIPPSSMRMGTGSGGAVLISREYAAWVRKFLTL
jgi:hypothetical protein